MTKQALLFAKDKTKKIVTDILESQYTIKM
jgi:hypothetical protein